MGIKRKMNINWTEEKIQEVLNNHYLSNSTKQYQINGLYIFNWESDYLCLTKSGLIHEVEIKISREDFKNDFKNKKEKHLLLEKLDTQENKPNFFYYCVPENLISVEEIPEYAGLIYVINEYRIDVIKPAPKINKNKVNFNSLNLTDKFYYNMVKWRKTALKTWKNDVDLLKEELKLSKVDENGKKYKYTLFEAHTQIDILEKEIERLTEEKKWLFDEYHYLNYNLRNAKKVLKENNIEFDEKETKN